MEHPGKNVLSDAGLVKWWKAVMDDIVNACTKDEKNSSGGQLRVESPCDLTWRHQRRNDAFTEGTVTEARSDDGA